MEIQLLILQDPECHADSLMCAALLHHLSFLLAQPHFTLVPARARFFPATMSPLELLSTSSFLRLLNFAPTTQSVLTTTPQCNPSQLLLIFFVFQPSSEYASSAKWSQLPPLPPSSDPLHTLVSQIQSPITMSCNC